MDEMLKNLPAWIAPGVSLVLLVLLIREKIVKGKNDSLETKKSALQLVQEEVKALAGTIERKDIEHRLELKEREKEWRAELDKKDTEHRKASAENTKLIADLTTKVEVYKTESNQKDATIKEQKAIIENRNPKLEDFLEQNIKIQKETLEFMKKYVTSIGNIK